MSIILILYYLLLTDAYHTHIMLSIVYNIFLGDSPIRR